MKNDAMLRIPKQWSKTMNTQQAYEALKGFAVRSIGVCGDKYTVTIGNCGRQMNKEVAFKGTDLEKIVNKIKNKY